MKRLWTILAALAAMTAGCCAAAPASEPAPIGIVALIHGRAEAVAPGGPGVRTAEVEDELAEGWRLRTAPLSAARLVFDDGSVVSLAPATVVVMDRLGVEAVDHGPARLVVIGVESGVLHARTGHIDDGEVFEVRTPQARAVASDAAFQVVVNPESGASEFLVLEGEIEVRAEDPRFDRRYRVEAGRRLQVFEDRLPLDPAPLTADQRLVVLDRVRVQPREGDPLFREMEPGHAEFLAAVRSVAVVPRDQAERALALLRSGRLELEPGLALAAALRAGLAPTLFNRLIGALERGSLTSERLGPALLPAPAELPALEQRLAAVLAAGD